MVTRTEAFSKKFKDRMYTKWLRPNARMETQWGTITDKEWCKLEVKRLNEKSGPTARIVKGYNGQICVVYDAPRISGDQNVN